MRLRSRETALSPNDTPRFDVANRLESSTSSGQTDGRLTVVFPSNPFTRVSAFITPRCRVDPLQWLDPGKNRSHRQPHGRPIPTAALMTTWTLR